MKQVAVIGLGRFGFNVAKALAKIGHEVLAVDIDEDLVQDILPYVTHAVQADAKDEKALKALGLRNFDMVIVAIGSDIQISILVTVSLKELGVDHVVAKAQDELHGKILSKVGADRVVYPERDMAVRVARNLISSNVLDHIEISDSFSILEINAPDWVVGKDLMESELRVKYSVTVMAIRRGDEIIVAPGGDVVLEQDDVLVVIGANKDLSNLKLEG